MPISHYLILPIFQKESNKESLNDTKYKKLWTVLIAYSSPTYLEALATLCTCGNGESQNLFHFIIGRSLEIFLKLSKFFYFEPRTFMYVTFTLDIEILSF